MILSDLPPAAAIFLAANILVYHFAPDPVFGPACTDLLLRVKRKSATPAAFHLGCGIICLVLSPFRHGRSHHVYRG